MFRKGASIDTRDLQKVLVIRRGSVGDTVMLTPLVRSLKTSFPNAREYVLANRGSLALIAGSPFVDETLAAPSRWKQWIGLIGQLRRKRIDTVLSFIASSWFPSWLFSVGFRDESASNLDEFRGSGQDDLATEECIELPVC
jgi:hypothetical protein